ncbi:DUF362 domain-containing protein [Candidatus Bathyarchaeota archaeon]|jgi:uncharacterized protein (DUF362 family)|nr:DUF362 domain-containing protein [Candidatus Bathyarchaeota archaeon]MBT4423986.1 DUF362 domain-containing protein [Candidatus Bathyarchaeota archaeon]MBT5641863.1 DUF362 domain-containing protein [Candidatus Bathyarchaeota archaeon]MBT6605919.1 DUF362 domain-containing protein [Candidatus Bathyarchaeota archaeon]MBT7186493.1 DUF362 domain-containing protein [Candidatus Bathyarchaeota archaeon]
MSKVSVVRRKRKPSDIEVFDLVKESIDLLGGIKTFVKKGDIVALKPNIVTGKLSGPGVTTDKRVVGAVIKLCQEAGASRVLVVEGADYASKTSEAFELSGVKAVAEELGAEMVDVDTTPLTKVKVPDPLLIDELEISKAFMDADVRINMPLMKTHDQLDVTLGIKNMKGVIPKYSKRDFHKKGVVKGVLDLNKAVPVDLTVLDAIVAMEGLGPAVGPKVELNTIISSADIYALDKVASRIMGFELTELDYLVQAAEAGLTDLDEEPEVIGEPINAFTYRFERAPTGLNFAEGVTVITKGACSACHGTIHSVFYDLEQKDLMGGIKDLTIVVGKHAEVPERLLNRPVILGICQERNRGKGCYAQGCPPNNSLLVAAINEACGLE